MKCTTRIILLFATVTLLPVFAWAGDGTLGTTSTTTSTLSLVVEDIIRISNVGNLTFANYTGALSDQTQNDDICIYRNDSGAAYFVTATTAESSFIVSDGGGNDIAYTLKFNDVSGTTGSVALVYNTQTAQTGANNTALDCGGTMNANFEVIFATADISVAPAATYAGTITFLVEPN